MLQRCPTPFPFSAACLAILLSGSLLALPATAQTNAPTTADDPVSAQATENVFLVTLDGLRWQELFSGIDSTLMRRDAYVDDPETLEERFWRPTPEARRAALMPFFWSTIAEEGQLYGNRAHGCEVALTNTHQFSYPGYNEILTGEADDDRIDSNDKVPNPNVTVLEYVNQQPGFADSVAAFGSWDVFPYIVNEARSGVPVNAGFEAAAGPELTQRERFLNELQTQVPSPWSSVRLDAFTHGYALEHLREHAPRLVYIAYGETDDFGHDGDYQAYIEAARRTDAFVQALWRYIQSTPQYRDRTTLLITTDHGRGLGDAWTGHGAGVEHSEETWFAALGPDTDARGEVRAACSLHQDQVATTVARLLGLRYGEADDGKGVPISSVFSAAPTGR